MAAEGLTGTQLAHCRELVDQPAAVEAFAERLTTVVAGDRRADLSRMTQHNDTRPVVPGVLFKADWSVCLVALARCTIVLTPLTPTKTPIR